MPQRPVQRLRRVVVDMRRPPRSPMEPPQWIVVTVVSSLVLTIFVAGQLSGFGTVLPLALSEQLPAPEPTLEPTSQPTPTATPAPTALPSGAIVLTVDIRTASFGLRVDAPQADAAQHVAAGAAVLPTGERIAERCRVRVLDTQAVIWLDCTALEVQP